MEALQAHELLNGNIAFLINRIDIVDPSEREEVVRYAQRALAKLGNPLVGQGRVFATAAMPVLEARHGGWRYEGTDDGIYQFEEWLQDLLGGSRGQNIAVLSRIGVLAGQLAEARVLLEQRLTHARSEMERQQKSYVEAQAARERQHRQSIAEDKLALTRFRAELTQLTSGFVTAVDARAASIMAQSDWTTKLSTCFEEPLKIYIEKVNSGAKLAVSRTGVKVPVFAVTANGTQVTAADDPSAWIGGVAGFVLGGWMDGGVVSVGAGAAAGAWISMNIFGKDIKKETRDKVKAAAEMTAPRLRAEAEQHLNSLEQQLAAQTRQPPRLNKPVALSRAEAAVKQYMEYVRWCEEFQCAVKSLQERLVR